MFCSAVFLCRGALENKPGEIMKNSRPAVSEMMTYVLFENLDLI